MPRIEELDLSEENKENIPPSVLNHDLSNIVDHFDRKFKDYQDYLDYLRTNLSDWIKDPDFLLFDAHYCQHRLLSQQCEEFNKLLADTERMKIYASRMDATQKHNAKLTTPKLLNIGFGSRLLELERPKKKIPKKSTPPTCSTC